MNLQPIENLRNLRVLVADDHPDNLDFMLLLLKNMVRKIDVVCDGLEALNMLETNIYDVVIMDYHMPKLDGCEVTRILREREGPKQHTPVIVLTADNERSSREKFSAAGSDDYLTKPVMINELLTKIMKVTEKV